MSEVNTGNVDSSSGNEGAAETQGNEQAEAQENGGEAAAAPEPKQAMQALKEKFKLTVDGEEFEEELDWNDKESIRKKLQLAKAADKRMSEAKAAKAKAFDIVKAFEDDPANILKRLGPKGREAAEKFLLEQIQEEMLSPEEREARMTKAELAKYREKDAQEAKSKEEQVMLAKQNHFAQEFQTTIISALEKLSLPKTPSLVKTMAGLMKQNLANGLTLDANDLAEIVRRDKNGEVQSIIRDMDGDQIISFLGEEVANKIRKSDLRKLQEKHSQVFQSGSPKRESSNPAPKSNEGRPMTMDEWKEQIAKRVNS